MVQHTKNYELSQVMFDGNDVDVLYNFLTEAEFNYTKGVLVRDFPELQALVYAPDKTLLDQIATIRGVKPETVHKEVGMESLYSLLVNKHYEQVIRDLNDPKFSMWRKSQILGLNVESLMTNRFLKVLAYLLVMGVALPILVAFLLSWWNFFLMIFLLMALWLPGFPVMQLVLRRFKEKLYNIVTRGN